MQRKALPIGIEDFKELISRNYYYVDKTDLIRELLTKKGKVNLFTRPRRFGKTLNLSMIQYFFENTDDSSLNKAHQQLFQGLSVMSAGSEIGECMTGYPVISLSLKSAKQSTFASAYYRICEEIWREFRRHEYVLESLDEIEEDIFRSILNRTGSSDAFQGALKFLCDVLEKYHKQRVIVLIDEYDVPLENAYFHGFYSEMIAWIRGMLELILKTNTSLEFAVITGCLRISKESIFTGLNNLNAISILSEPYGEYFGFTQPELDEMLFYYQRDDKRDLMKEWYDGYLFGEKEVYNPWSVVNYMASLCANANAFPKPFWSNTSSNEIVKELIEYADLKARADLELLIEGKTISKPVHEDITYEDINQSQDNLWNFLFFTGYLKKTGSYMEGEQQWVILAIPNLEVKYIYRNAVLAWFDKRIKTHDLSMFYHAMEEGNTTQMEQILVDLLSETISFYDYAENYYHGFLSGIFQGNHKYLVKSNRESGFGRPDLILRTPSVRGRAFVIEIKTASDFKEMEKKCQEALNQIETKYYREELENEGFKDIRCFGFCFWKKEVLIREVQKR